MSILYAMRPVCDLYFYVTILGLFSLLRFVGTSFLAMPLFIGAGVAIGWAIRKKGRIVRYLPLALGALPLAFGVTIPRILFLLPALFYSFFYVKQNTRVPDWYYTFDRFRYSFIPLGFLGFIGYFVNEGDLRTVVPPLFMYLTLSITLLRILRHDEAVIRQRRFRMINMIGIAGACIAGLILASDRALALLRQAALLARDYILMPLLNVLMYALQLFAMVVEWLFSKIRFDGKMPEMQMQQGMEQGEQFVEEAMRDDPFARYPWLMMLLRVLGIAVLVVLLLLLLRFLARQAVRLTEVTGKDTREDLLPEDEDDGPKGLRGVLARRNDPVLAVRYIYKKYLLLARDRDIPLTGRQNSLQIRDLSAPSFDKDALDTLRAIYIRARYDNLATKEDVKAAGEALSLLKKRT